MYTIASYNGLGNVFTAALRRSMWALQTTDAKDLVQSTIRNLPGYLNYYNQTRTALDRLQQRLGTTNTIIQIQDKLDEMRRLISDLDDAHRAAVEAYRADGGVVETAESSTGTLGLIPLLIIVGAAAATVIVSVAVYTLITQWGTTNQTYITSASRLQGLKMEIDALVASGNAQQIPQINPGGGNPSGPNSVKNSLLSIDGSTFAVLGAIGVAVYFFFNRKKSA